MHEDFEAAELLPHRLGDCRASLRRRKVRLNEFAFADILGTLARRRKHPRACLAERGHHRRAHAFRAAGHERALAVKFEIAVHQRISMNLSAGQHEAEAHRDWTSRKAAGELRLEDALVAALSEFERRNGVAVFFPRGGHPILYRRNALKGLTFVAYDRISCETLRHRFQRAGVFNLNVMLNRSWKLNRHSSSLRAGRTHLQSA